MVTMATKDKNKGGRSRHAGYSPGCGMFYEWFNLLNEIKVIGRLLLERCTACDMVFS
jgi:hypothetical protein